MLQLALPVDAGVLPEATVAILCANHACRMNSFRQVACGSYDPVPGYRRDLSCDSTKVYLVYCYDYCLSNCYHKC